MRTITIATRRRQKAHDEISSLLQRFYRGAAAEQDVTKALWEYKTEILIALEMQIRRTKFSRDWRRAKAPRGRPGERIDLPPEPRTPVLHVRSTPRCRKRQPGIIPKRFRYIQQICMYLYRRQDCRAIDAMADYLATAGVLTAQHKPWTPDLLTATLNPSEVWMLLFPENRT